MDGNKACRVIHFNLFLIRLKIGKNGWGVENVSMDYDTTIEWIGMDENSAEAARQELVALLTKKEEQISRSVQLFDIFCKIERNL